jgi:hypothetical protein
MKFGKLFLLFLFLISSFAMAKNQAVYYEPNPVTLIGFVKHITFPGPPNYESIKEGDLNETGPYLILKNPIDAYPAPNRTEMDNNDELEKNVSILQIVMPQNIPWKKVKEGNYVRIHGTLFRRLSGHNHSRVLIEVKSIDVLPKRKIRPREIMITKEDYVAMSQEDQEPKLTLKARSEHFYKPPCVRIVVASGLSH